MTAGPVIDVHTHMLTQGWLDLLREHGGPRYSVAGVPGGHQAVHLDGAPFMTLTDGMFDYAARIQAMDDAGVDVAVVSLTCPNVFWGAPEVSVTAARSINDDMATAQHAHPTRLRHLCSVPWDYEALALAELDRAVSNGAIGVMVLANINGRPLTHPRFARIWSDIEERGLPVLVHPTAPPGTAEMALHDYNLVASVGFMFDTTLAVTRMIFDGFFDRHPDLKVIAGHGGGTLPYVVGRLDRCFTQMDPCRERIARPPSEYLRRLWYDTVLYEPEALRACLSLAGSGRLLYGSDYPHNIGDMTGCLARVDALGGAEAAAIRGANAAELFGL